MENHPVVRFRTEAFSGSGVRDAAEVMAFETFELGNTDILETLCNSHLKESDMFNICSKYIKDLEDCVINLDEFPEEDGISFYKEVLEEIARRTGITVKYALWLADKETVTDRDWYGKDMVDESDFDAYVVGPIILSDLGSDGTLYGYTEMPVPLENSLDAIISDASSRSEQQDNANTQYNFEKEF